MNTKKRTMRLWLLFSLLMLEPSCSADEVSTMSLLWKESKRRRVFSDPEIEYGYGWASVFSVDDEEHIWLIQKVGGNYFDSVMRFVFFAADAADEKALELNEETAKILIKEDDCEVVEEGGSITPVNEGSCHELVVGSGDDSHWTIVTTKVVALAVFSLHVPTEFARDKRYFFAFDGTDIEPVIEKFGMGDSHNHSYLDEHSREEEYHNDPYDHDEHEHDDEGNLSILSVLRDIICTLFLPLRLLPICSPPTPSLSSVPTFTDTRVPSSFPTFQTTDGPSFQAFDANVSSKELLVPLEVITLTALEDVKPTLNTPFHETTTTTTLSPLLEIKPTVLLPSPQEVTHAEGTMITMTPVVHETTPAITTTSVHEVTPTPTTTTTTVHAATPTTTTTTVHEAAPTTTTVHGEQAAAVSSNYLTEYGLPTATTTTEEPVDISTTPQESLSSWTNLTNIALFSTKANMTYMDNDDDNESPTPAPTHGRAYLPVGEHALPLHDESESTTTTFFSQLFSRPDLTPHKTSPLLENSSSEDFWKINSTHLLEDIVPKPTPAPHGRGYLPNTDQGNFNVVQHPSPTTTEVIFNQLFEQNQDYVHALPLNSGMDVLPVLHWTWTPSSSPPTTNLPTSSASKVPSNSPTNTPSQVLSKIPTIEPNQRPSSSPTFEPSAAPSIYPTSIPTYGPSRSPTRRPTQGPSFKPTSVPSKIPSHGPTLVPTQGPSSSPTSQPSLKPSINPSVLPSSTPSVEPTKVPTDKPSSQPTASPSFTPTEVPSLKPSTEPTEFPSTFPSFIPSTMPTSIPSFSPSKHPTTKPTVTPSLSPTSIPSSFPSARPVYPHEACLLDEEESCRTHLVSIHADPMARTLGLYENVNRGHMCSPNYKFRFGISSTAMCLCEGQRKVWCASADNKEPPYAVLEADGHLVLYQPKRFGRREVLWQSPLATSTEDPVLGTKLRLQNNGELTITPLMNASQVLWRAKKETWEGNLP